MNIILDGLPTSVKIGDATVKINTDFRVCLTGNPNTSGLDTMRDGIDGIGNSALNTGDLIRANLLSDTIMQGVMALGAQLKEVAINSVSGAMSNETAFAKVKTLLKGNDLEKYFEGLIDISNRTGVAFTDLAESMYSALSASVPQDNVLEFVENSVKLSKGGFTQTATAIDIVTTALNAYQMEMSEAAHVQDVLITTQNLGKTTVDELAGNMGKLIPTAKSVNVEFDQLGAMYATITANGVATAETTTYLNAMINELGASGSSAEKAMMAAVKGTDMAGKKFSEISSMGYDVTDVLALMSDYAQSTGKSLADMFSSSEGAKAANILLSNMSGFKDNIVAMAQSLGAAGEAADTMMDTAAEKVQVAKNQIDNLVTTIGQSLLPIIGETADEVDDALQSGDITETAEDIGKFVSGTLSVLLKNIKLIGSAVTGVTAGVVAFKTASVLTKVIASWQTAALQVNLFVASQGRAALQTAATNGTLTLQEVVLAALSGKLDAATIKTVALNTAMSLNPAGAIAAVIGVLATAITAYTLSAKDANEQMEEFRNAAESAYAEASENEEAVRSIEKLADEYKQLKEKAKESTRLPRFRQSRVRYAPR
ncbi:MAG: phage tail tape measure protein [Oscillospiraceae bacterium]